jgi:hypothetical protein
MRTSPVLTLTDHNSLADPFRERARPLTELQLFHSQRVVPHHTALTLGALGDCVSGAYRKRERCLLSAVAARAFRSASGVLDHPLLLRLILRLGSE